MLTKKYLKNIIREAIEDFIDEADYPSSFNMDEFKTLNSFNTRLNYCKTHLKPISSGSGRYVFEIDNNTVLKLAKNKKGIAQNETEYSIANDAYINIIAEVFDADEHFRWIEMEKLNKCTASKFKIITEMNFNEFSNSLRYYYNDNLISGRNFFREPLNYNEILENKFFNEIVDLMFNFDMLSGDLGRLSTYGITSDGNNIKIVDAGLTNSVYNTHYK